MRFDLLIRGGEVVDPGGGHEGRLDVAIERDRIAAVDREIPAESALRVIDATGQIVTPGLVDLHTHVFHKLTYWGIDPDPVGSRSGVTTWNDAGSVGALTLEGLPRLRRPAGEGRDHRLREHLEHRPRLRRLRVRQPVVPRRRPAPPHGRSQPRPRARREGADGQPRPARRRRARAAAACAAGGRRVRAAADDAHLVRPAHARGGAALPEAGRRADALLHRPRDEDRRRRGPAARRRRARLGVGRRLRRRPRHGLVLVRDRRGGDGRRAEAGRDLDRPPSAQRQRADVRPADDAQQVPPPRDVARGGDRGGDGPSRAGPRARARGRDAASLDRARTSRCSGSTRAASRCRTSTGTSARPSGCSGTRVTIVGGRELERLPLPPRAPWTDEPIWPDVQIPFTEKQRALHEQGRTPDAMAAAAGEPTTADDASGCQPPTTNDRSPTCSTCAVASHS